MNHAIFPEELATLKHFHKGVKYKHVFSFFISSQALQSSYICVKKLLGNYETAKNVLFLLYFPLIMYPLSIIVCFNMYVLTVCFLLNCMFNKKARFYYKESL